MSVWSFFLFGSPCIWTKNSVLMRRAASLSFSFLEPHSESTSSMKMIEGLCWRARSNKFFTSLGETRTDGEKWDWGRHKESSVPTDTCSQCWPHKRGSTGHRSLETVKQTSVLWIERADSSWKLWSDYVWHKHNQQVQCTQKTCCLCFWEEY